MPSPSPLHPALQALLAGFAETPMPAIETMDIHTMRQIFDTPLPMAKAAVGGVQELQVPGAEGPLAARLYLPQAQPQRLIVFFHGGGFVMGTLETHDSLCRHLCQELNSSVLSVAYRLAPEHPFPAAPEDCYAATQWAAAQRQQLASADCPLLLAGDSAGAGLCAAVCLLSRERSEAAAIDGQMLFYPTLTPQQDTDSYRELGNGDFFLSRGMMQFYWDNYLPAQLDASQTGAVPLQAVSLAGLPPTQLVMAELDPLKDEGLAFAERLQQAGINVCSEVVPGMIHGFMSMPGVEEEVKAILRAIKCRL
ncbi:alpha/beta hydrolase [Aestuariicella hydrocarbonica]|uniref:Alpha/beta hydrolase n=1 Tax=Pseudomaricurvus hydrocarbonicus TaxID=1470433 RepID=A0A9E5JV15_9GAMM|nr:alpha/beta hydrolase [Aestuariicella hydrocarbonica]NHO66103.1 alpha/beta hydrolase [Aestuariicella hydrocarbonica]